MPMMALGIYGQPILLLVIKLNSGLILQFGNFSSSVNTTTTITFPIAFPKNICSLTACHHKAAGWTNGANVNYISLALASVAIYQCDGSGAAWMAIGY